MNLTRMLTIFLPALIDRLAQFATREDSPGIPGNIQLFNIFSDEISSIIRARPEMPPEDIISLEVSLMNLDHKCFTERVDMTRHCPKQHQGSVHQC